MTHVHALFFALVCVTQVTAQAFFVTGRTLGGALSLRIQLCTQLSRELTGLVVVLLQLRAYIGPLQVSVIVACVSSLIPITPKMTPEKLAEDIFDLSAYFGATPDVPLSYSVTGFNAAMFNKMKVRRGVGLICAR